MRCYFCNGTEFDRQKVNYILRDRDHILGTIVVEADICCQCKEAYYTKEVIDQIMSEREKLLASKSAKR